MKGWLMRVAGGYVGLGALAFLIHRARYRSTIQLRDWTDRRSHQLAAELGQLAAELESVRHQLHAQRRRSAAGVPAVGRLPA